MTGLLTDARLWLALMCLCELACELAVTPDRLVLLLPWKWLDWRIGPCEWWNEDAFHIRPSGVAGMVVCAWMAAYLSLRHATAPTSAALMAPAVGLLACRIARWSEDDSRTSAQLAALRMTAAFVIVMLAAPACAGALRCPADWDAGIRTDLVCSYLPLLALLGAATEWESGDLHATRPYSDPPSGRVWVERLHAPHHCLIPLYACWAVCLPVPPTLAASLAAA